MNMLFRNRRAHQPPHDYGGTPYVVDIGKASQRNLNFRTTIWTGKHLQSTVMSIPAGGEVGTEIHQFVDQLVLVTHGTALTLMGSSKNNLDYRKPAFEDYAIFIPAGMWHNIINTGNTMLKLFIVYSPPEHPQGTVHKTAEDAEEPHTP